MKQGTQIAYIPNHANGDINHPDVEFGFIAVVRQNGFRDNDLTYFCRFWLKGKLGTLRTLANSEACNERNLRVHKSVAQSIVDEWIERARTMTHDEFVKLNP